MMVQQPVAQTSWCLACFADSGCDLFIQGALIGDHASWVFEAVDEFQLYIIDEAFWLWSNRVRCTLEKHLSFSQGRLSGQTVWRRLRSCSAWLAHLTTCLLQHMHAALYSCTHMLHFIVQLCHTQTHIK